MGVFRRQATGFATDTDVLAVSLPDVIATRGLTGGNVLRGANGNNEAVRPNVAACILAPTEPRQCHIVVRQNH